MATVNKWLLWIFYQQVARSCILTLFILNPTVNHYLELAQTYKMPYERDKDPGLNFSANLR